MGKVQNNLAKVILRLDFQDIFEVKPETLKKIREAIKDSGFVTSSTENIDEIEFRFNFDSLAVPPPKVLQKKEVNVFSWNDEDGSNIALFKVSPLFLLFEYNQPKRYYASLNSDTYRELFNEIAKIIKADEQGSLVPTRLGFRKTNEFFFNSIKNARESVQFNTFPTEESLTKVGITFNEFLIQGSRIEYNESLDVRAILQSRLESGKIQIKEIEKDVIRYLFDIDAYSNKNLNLENLVTLTETLSSILRRIYDNSIDFEKYESPLHT
jgi:hypothetical protein